jgi:hypothetical protein
MAAVGPSSENMRSWPRAPPVTNRAPPSPLMRLAFQAEVDVPEP